MGGYGWVEGDEVLGISREIFDNFRKNFQEFSEKFSENGWDLLKFTETY